MQQDSLPLDFAEQVLELQAQLDDSYDLQVITQLNELYRIAIDYYIRFENTKARHFQRKITKLLAHPSTLSLIQAQANQSKGQIGRSKINGELAKYRQTECGYVRNLMEQSERALQKQQKVKKLNLNKQQQELDQRILLKKCRSQERLIALSG